MRRSSWVWMSGQDMNTRVSSSKPTLLRFELIESVVVVVSTRRSKNSVNPDSISVLFRRNNDKTLVPG